MRVGTFASVPLSVEGERKEAYFPKHLQNYQSLKSSNSIVPNYLLDTMWPVFHFV